MKHQSRWIKSEGMPGTYFNPCSACIDLAKRYSVKTGRAWGEKARELVVTHHGSKRFTEDEHGFIRWVPLP